VRTSGTQLRGESVALDDDAFCDRSPRLGRQVRCEFEHIAAIRLSSTTVTPSNTGGASNKRVAISMI
jgi:hypothetical protein